MEAEEKRMKEPHTDEVRKGEKGIRGKRRRQIEE
jgi:hypothetical protein